MGEGLIGNFVYLLSLYTVTPEMFDAWYAEHGTHIAQGIIDGLDVVQRFL